MGRKRAGAGQYLYLCIALLIGMSVSGCASLQAVVERVRPASEARRHFLDGQRLLAQGEFEGSLRENHMALSLSAGLSPGDEALFAIGLIYAHPANPNRNYVRSIAAFKRLSSEYPQSPRAEQARVWAEVLLEDENLRRVHAKITQENQDLKQENENLRRVSAASTREAAQENENLRRDNESMKRASVAIGQENERLKQMIEQSGKVDIEIEKKRREKVR